MNDLSRIIFIGTGSGKVTLNRFHSSFIIDHLNFRLLVDAGDSVSRALLKSGIEFNSIDGIIISHFHPDHICGLPLLLLQMKMEKRAKPLKIFIHKSLSEDLKKLLFTTYVIPDRLNFDVGYIKYDFENEIEINSDFKVRAFQNTHLDKYEFFVKSDKISLACASFCFKAGGKKIFYSGDIGGEDDFDNLDEHKVEVFISETTHINPHLVVKTAEHYKSNIIVFTHISEQYETQTKEIVLNHTGKPAIFEAFEGLEIAL